MSKQKWKKWRCPSEAKARDLRYALERTFPKAYIDRMGFAVWTPASISEKDVEQMADGLGFAVISLPSASFEP